MSKNSFLRGAMVLTAAGIIVKILGGLNRILLSRLLGGEGIGLYQMAYPVYILLLSIIGAGIPIAVSIMIAEEAARGHYSGVRRIFRVTLAFMTVVAVLCGLALPFGAQAMVHFGIVRDARAFPALAVLAPALTLSVIACCFRGYFQGLQQMTPTALSQMADQFVRVCTMLVLAWLFLPKGLEWAAAGAAFGAVPGAAAGLAIIAFLYYRHSRKALPEDDGVFVVRPARRIIRRLVVLAVPVAAANMLLPAVASIDLFIVPLRLEAAGYTTHQATALYGYLTGMANGLVQLPAILTIALATSLVPAVSAAFSQHNREIILNRTHTAMRIANVIAKKQGCEALVTGESLAQVASQTVKALQCTDAAQDLPILRPLIGMDKTEIIETSRHIGTYETSILPYEDCCTIFTPPHPKIRPELAEILEAEAAMPGLAALEAEAAEQTERIRVRITDQVEFEG